MTTSSPALPTAPESAPQDVTLQPEAVAASASGPSAVDNTKTDDLEKELELDLENLKLDENIDTSVGVGQTGLLSQQAEL